MIPNEASEAGFSAKARSETNNRGRISEAPGGRRAYGVSREIGDDAGQVAAVMGTEVEGATERLVGWVVDMLSLPRRVMTTF